MLTGGIRAGSESSLPYDLTPPLRGAARIGRSFDLNLLQSFTGAISRVWISTYGSFCETDRKPNGSECYRF
jgi:hypothetical protein